MTMLSFHVTGSLQRRRPFALISVSSPWNVPIKPSGHLFLSSLHLSDSQIRCNFCNTKIMLFQLNWSQNKLLVLSVSSSKRLTSVLARKATITSQLRVHKKINTTYLSKLLVLDIKLSFFNMSVHLCLSFLNKPILPSLWLFFRRHQLPLAKLQ